MNWFLMAMKRFSVFSGRSRRSEYWYFYLFAVLIFIAATVVDHLAGTYSTNLGAGLFSSLSALIFLVPHLAVATRRLHDTNRSAWWLLFGLVPFLGGVTLLVFFVIDSDVGRNEFGPNPKEAAV